MKTARKSPYFNMGMDRAFLIFLVPISALFPLYLFMKRGENHDKKKQNGVLLCSPYAHVSQP